MFLGRLNDDGNRNRQESRQQRYCLCKAPRKVRGARFNHLKRLEAESIYIFREAAAEFARPVMLYSIGKDSSVMLRLAQKAFFPGKIPFPLLHVDTSYKFPEMIEFRDRYTREIGAELIVHKNAEALEQGANPFALGTQKCCGLLKTKSLLDALAEGGFDAAFGGARRDEEKSRAKERIYSFRDAAGQWDPKNQRPELWNIFNARINKGESIRVFPLSNWTELDVWLYIHAENIPIVPLYFAKEREVVVRGESIVPIYGKDATAARREVAAGDVPDAVAGMHAVQRGDSFGGGYDSQDHSRAAGVPALGAGEPRDRSRRGRLHGDQEAGGILLMSLAARLAAGRSCVAAGPSSQQGPAALHDRRQRG